MGGAGLEDGAGALVVQEWEDNLHWWVEECDTLQARPRPKATYLHTFLPTYRPYHLPT